MYQKDVCGFVQIATVFFDLYGGGGGQHVAADRIASVGDDTLVSVAEKTCSW